MAMTGALINRKRNEKYHTMLICMKLFIILCGLFLFIFSIYYFYYSLSYLVKIALNLAAYPACYQQYSKIP